MCAGTYRQPKVRMEPMLSQFTCNQCCSGAMLTRKVTHETITQSFAHQWIHENWR